MPNIDLVILIPESTRKRSAGESTAGLVYGFQNALPGPARRKLESLQAEIRSKAKPGDIDPKTSLPAYRLYDGNMYRHIPREAWEQRAPGVEVLIASGLYGLVASRDTVDRYVHSMAEPMPPFGKLNRWWHDHGLPEILAAYVTAVRPKAVVDLLSLEYREAVAGYADGLSGIPVKTIDFPGMGRASQPRRGEKVAEVLRSGKA